MQTNDDVNGLVSPNGAARPPSVGEHGPNGDASGDTQIDALGMAELLHALQAMRVGDFSVRMPATRSASPARSPTPSTKSSPPTSAWRSSSNGSARWSAAKARPASALTSALSDGAWGEMEASVNTLIDDLLWPTTEVTRAIAAVAKGDLLQTVPLEVDGRPLKGEFLRSADHRQHHDQAAQRVHLRSDARRARSRHRRQARRPGAGPRGHRRVEGPDRKRQLDGVAT